MAGEEQNLNIRQIEKKFTARNKKLETRPHAFLFSRTQNQKRSNVVKCKIENSENVTQYNLPQIWDPSKMPQM